MFNTQNKTRSIFKVILAVMILISLLFCIEVIGDQTPLRIKLVLLASALSSLIMLNDLNKEIPKKKEERNRNSPEV